MEAFSIFIKHSLPKYLENLPIPNSFSGFASLTGAQLISVGIFFTLFAIVICGVLKLVLPTYTKPAKINSSIKKDNPKVVDVCDVEDIDKEKICYCRCWKSAKFPLCDGAHNDHNEKTGDNVGPLVIRRKIDGK